MSNITFRKRKKSAAGTDLTLSRVKGHLHHLLSGSCQLLSAVGVGQPFLSFQPLKQRRRHFCFVFLPHPPPPTLRPFNPFLPVVDICNSTRRQIVRRLHGDRHETWCHRNWFRTEFGVSVNATGILPLCYHPTQQTALTSDDAREATTTRGSLQVELELSSFPLTVTRDRCLQTNFTVFSLADIY